MSYNIQLKTLKQQLKEYDVVFITNLPSFYKVRQWNEIAKVKKVLIVFLNSQEGDRNKDFISECPQFDCFTLSSKFCVSIIELFRILKNIKFNNLLLGGWDDIRLLGLILLNPKSSKSLLCESSIYECSSNVVKNFIKKVLLKRVSKVFPSGIPQGEIFKKLNGYDNRDLPISEDMYYAYKVINKGNIIYRDGTTVFEYFIVGDFKFLNHNNEYYLVSYLGDDAIPEVPVLKINGKEIGMLGEIHPTTLKKEGIDPTVYFEMDLTKFLEIKTSKVRYTPVSKFPAVTRDIAIVVKEDVTINALVRSMKKAGGSILNNVDVFDVYQGEHVQQGYKSVALTMTFVDPTKTLVDATINELFNHTQILMKHELQSALVKLNIKNQVSDSTILKGNINSLVQVLNNLISIL